MFNLTLTPIILLLTFLAAACGSTATGQYTGG
jgi:hypothetical protein